MKFSRIFKISIAGNCQLAPLVNFLKSVLPEIELIYLPIYTCSSTDVIDFHRHVSNSDILINTLTTEPYRDNIGLGSNRLKSLLPLNSLNLIIPSIYYTGYFPTVSSFKKEDALVYNYYKNIFQKSKYHDYIPIVLAQFGVLDIEYKDLEEKLSPYSSRVREIVISNHKKSLENLKNKELSCTLIVSDILSNIYKGDICFYSNNHPTTEILFPVYIKILEHIEKKIDPENKLISTFKNYKLDTLNAHDQVYVHTFVKNFLLDKNIDYKILEDSNILSTITKYYIDSNMLDKNEIKNSAYKNSVNLLKLAGVL